MEFFLEKTLAQFNHAGSRLNWNWPELFSEFEHVLGDSYHTTWAEVLNEHFPEPLEEASTYSHDKKEGFKRAIELFITKILNNKKPRDLQYIYMAPKGDYVLQGTYLPCRACICTILKRCSTSPSSLRRETSQNPRTSLRSNGTICHTTRVTTRNLS